MQSTSVERPQKAKPTSPAWLTERMNYLGCLQLLAEVAVHVPAEHRESIASALDDAQEAGLITYSRTLRRFDIELVPSPEAPRA